MFAKITTLLLQCNSYRMHQPLLLAMWAHVHAPHPYIYIAVMYHMSYIALILGFSTAWTMPHWLPRCFVSACNISYQHGFMVVVIYPLQLKLECYSNWMAWNYSGPASQPTIYSMICMNNYTVKACLGEYILSVIEQQASEFFMLKNMTLDFPTLDEQWFSIKRFICSVICY